MQTFAIIHIFLHVSSATFRSAVNSRRSRRRLSPVVLFSISFYLIAHMRIDTELLPLRPFATRSEQRAYRTI